MEFMYFLMNSWNHEFMKIDREFMESSAWSAGALLSGEFMYCLVEPTAHHTNSVLGDECGSTHPRNSAHRAWFFRVPNASANHGRKLSSSLSIQA